MPPWELYIYMNKPIPLKQLSIFVQQNYDFIKQPKYTFALHVLQCHNMYSISVSFKFYNSGF